MKHISDMARALHTSAQSYNTLGGQAGQMKTTARLNRVPVKENNTVMRHVKGQISRPTLRLGLVIFR